MPRVHKNKVTPATNAGQPMQSARIPVAVGTDSNIVHELSSRKRTRLGPDAMACIRPAPRRRTFPAVGDILCQLGYRSKLKNWSMNAILELEDASECYMENIIKDSIMLAGMCKCTEITANHVRLAMRVHRQH